MKICGLKFFSLFVCLLSVGLFGISIATTHAAEGEIGTYYYPGSSGDFISSGINSRNFTITNGTNQVLICSARNHDENGTQQLEWAGQAMTRYIDYGTQGSDMDIFYLINPTVGTFTLLTTSGYTSGFNCIVHENIDQNNPIATTTIQTTGLESGNYIPFTKTQTEGIITVDEFRLGRCYLTNSWNNLAYGYTYAKGSSGYIGMATQATSTQTISIQIFDSCSFSYFNQFVELKKYIAPTYCGDGLCQTETENCSSCSADCGDCASDPNTDNSTSIFFFSNPYNLYNQTTGKIYYIYNQNIITPYDYIEIRKISDDWKTSEFIATSTIIDNTGFFVDKNNGNSFFSLNGNASTTGFINYDIIGHFVAYWSPTLGDVPATTSIPYVVVVNWQNTVIPTAADILAASSTNPFYDDQAMYDAACSAEEWATPDPQMWISGTPMPALNFTVIGCKSKLALIIAGNKFTTIITNRLYAAQNIIKNVFPFNIYVNLNNSWKKSATATVLPQLSFLAPIDGNLTAQIPTGGTSTATIILWGKNIFTSTSTLGVQNATKTNQLFLAIKTIIKWGLWGLFAFWVIKNGKNFVKGLTNGE